MCPVYIELVKSDKLITKLYSTSQHKDMLFNILNFFSIKPDYDLSVMKNNQNLYDLSALIMTRLGKVLESYKPDLVLVHGDTTTGFISSLASFYNKSKVGHVEAGLRTYNKFSPFPEEINRQLISKIADYHFSPTLKSKQNLLDENIEKEKIIVTGNTVIDALQIGSKIISENLTKEIKEFKKLLGKKNLY